MTSEDDFNRQLDADPDNWQCRLVFADWLQDRDDRRAEGYRALGINRLRPIDSWHDGGALVRHPNEWTFWVSHGSDTPSCLDADWWWRWRELVLDAGPALTGVPFRVTTRREAEELAVQAYLSLPVKVKKRVMKCKMQHDGPKLNRSRKA